MKWKRKIQKMGPGSFGVTLPRKWIDHHELGQGDEISIIFYKDTLFLEVEGKNMDKEIVEVTDRVFRKNKDELYRKTIGVDISFDKIVEFVLEEIE